MPATKKKTPSMHHPRRRNVTTSMVGLRTVTYAKISPKMANLRAGKRRKRRRNATTRSPEASRARNVTRASLYTAYLCDTGYITPLTEPWFVDLCGTHFWPAYFWITEARGRYHGGGRPSSDDSFHSPTVIPPRARDKPIIMKRYHRRRTTR